jgi:glycosyltransferase involved in cell wall biosynthesis
MSSVDVVIPCYRYARFLEQSTRSVLTQHGPDIRVLIIDDASPDDTVDVASRLAREDSRVAVRHHLQNWGHIATYNEGLAWAQSDYVILLSADDALLPGALARAVRVMDAHPEAAFLYGRKLEIGPEGAGQIRTPHPQDETYAVMTGPTFIEKTCRSSCNAVSTPTALVRTAIQHRAGGYLKELPHSGDLEMWLRLAVLGSVGVLNAVQAAYRRHGENMNLAFRGQRDYLQVRDAFTCLFLNWGNRISGGGELQRMAIRNLSERAFWEAQSMLDEGHAQAAGELAAVAAEIWPEIEGSPSWSRYRWKQRVGRFWPAFRPVVSLLQST